MATPEVVEAAPWWAQYAAGVTAFGSLAGIFFNAFRKARKDDPEPAKSLVLDRADMADIKPITDALMRIVQATEGTRDDTHEILALARKEAQDDQVDRLAEEKADKIIARERKAYEERFHEDVARRMTRLPPGE